MDTIYSDAPAIDNGSTATKTFVGTEKMVTDVCRMISDKQFVNMLSDNIRQRGAMDMLMSDSTQVEVSNKVRDMLNSLLIDDWKSEPHRQHQNIAERRCQMVKRYMKTLLDRTGATSYC